MNQIWQNLGGGGCLPHCVYDSHKVLLLAGRNPAGTLSSVGLADHLTVITSTIAWTQFMFLVSLDLFVCHDSVLIARLLLELSYMDSCTARFPLVTFARVLPLQ